MAELELDLVLAGGQDPFGIDLVHAHAVLAQHGIPEVAGHGHERALAHAVVQEGRFAGVSIHAADVEHAAPVGREVGQPGLDRRPISGQALVGRDSGNGSAMVGLD